MGVPRKNATYTLQTFSSPRTNLFVLGTTRTTAISVPITMPMARPATAMITVFLRPVTTRL